jgi:hypothetical protein
MPRAVGSAGHGCLDDSQDADIGGSDFEPSCSVCTMAKFNNGHIIKGEQKALSQQENAVSGQIGR